jgi:DMSO/TMAO reductase YedYZ molybdopterin-dependent catalytic subunit
VLGGLAGLLAAGVALGVAELVAGLIGPGSSPVVAVGNAAIALAPEPVKEFAIRTFGSNDKPALVTGTLIVIALYAVAVGLVALRHRRAGEIGVLLFGLVGIVAALTRPAGTTLDGLPSFVGAVVGVVALRVLIAPLRRPVAAPEIPATASRSAGDQPAEERPAEDAPAEQLPRERTGVDRRGFLVSGAVAVGVAVVAGGGGRLLQRRFDVATEREALTLPRPASPAPALPAGADLAPRVPGLTPLVTSGSSFYRVDTAITVPQIRPSSYRLALTGRFGRRRTFTLADLYRRPDLMERDVTLTCVSNEVGGDLAGNARWLGVPLGTFLRENDLRPEATQLVCRSTDGMTIGASAGAALDTPDAMLAIGMNGRPLPVAHGFPVRMIIPGQYGYVSACKWLASIEATTYDDYDPYWVRQGWAAQGPILIASRIDTPSPLRSYAAGRRSIAGVAWAQTRGIARVEVKVDDGEWTAARLAPDPGADVWRQWVLPFDFGRGSHTISVRATSADGELQTENRADPYPAGATGWHTVTVETT